MQTVTFLETLVDLHFHVVEKFATHRNEKPTGENHENAHDTRKNQDVFDGRLPVFVTEKWAEKAAREAR